MSRRRAADAVRRGAVVAAVLLLACGTPEPDDSSVPRASAPTLSTSSSSSEAPAPPVRFHDVTAAVGLGGLRHLSGTAEQRYILESISGGAAWADLDGDGWLDLVLVDGAPLDGPAPADAGHRLLRNVAAAEGRRFDDVTAASGLTTVDWGMGVAIGDVDNDGDPDLYITAWGKDQLQRNDGDLRLSPVNGGPVNEDWGTSATFVDLDNDGVLDLYVANYLEFDLADPPAGGNWCSFKGLDAYCGPEGIPAQADRVFRGLGDGRFEDRSTATGVADHALPALGVVGGDVDDDGDIDLYVANDSEPNLLWRNDGDWRLAELGTRSGSAYSETGLAQAGMGVDAGDVDRDGDLDLYVTNFSDDVNTLYANDGQGRFTDATFAVNLGGAVRPLLGWSTLFLDADNDSWLDLFIANGHVYPALGQQAGSLTYAQRNLLYRNEGGRFVEIGRAAGLDAIAVSRGAAAGDYDNDGDTDIIVVNLNDRPRLWRNEGGNRSDWVGLDLTGSASNRDAIGARVHAHGGAARQTIEVQRGRGYQSASDPRLRLGLGDGGLDSLVIRWPSGERQVLRDLPTRRYHALTEGQTPLAREPVPVPDAATPAAVTPDEGDTAPPSVAGWEIPRLRSEAGRLYAAGHYGASARALQEVIGRDSTDVASHVNLAMVQYSGLGRYAEAERILRTALQRDPKHADAHRLLGQVLLRQGRPDAAAATLQRAAQIAPQAADVAGWLGLAHERAGDDDRAIAEYRRSASLAPWDPRPHLNLGTLYQRLGRDDFAQRHFALFEELEPVHARVVHYRRKAQEYPDNAGAPLLLARAYEEQGRPAPAAQAYQQALQLDSTLAAAHHGFGRSLQRIGRLDVAVAALGRARRLAPDDPAILGDLGQAYHYQKRFAEAVEAYRAANRLDPSIPVMHANLGMAEAMLGNLDAATSALRRSLELDAAQPSTRDALAQVLLARGDTIEAVSQWRLALEDDPDHAGARRGLDRLGR
jgi:tetratricopeptide (TPR) repeat protein